ncbi:MAG: hypothetical protein HPY71_15480 [Firmicutes bacterium]|nr:hypothetical protein [Bacillota bacterium]
MNRFIVTIIVATIGGLAGYKLRIPAGAMIGAMFAVGVYNIIGGLHISPLISVQSFRLWPER